MHAEHRPDTVCCTGLLLAGRHSHSVQRMLHISHQTSAAMLRRRRAPARRGVKAMLAVAAAGSAGLRNAADLPGMTSTTLPPHRRRGNDRGINAAQSLERLHCLPWRLPCRERSSCSQEDRDKHLYKNSNVNNKHSKKIFAGPSGITQCFEPRRDASHAAAQLPRLLQLQGIRLLSGSQRMRAAKRCLVLGCCSSARRMRRRSGSCLKHRARTSSAASIAWRNGRAISAATIRRALHAEAEAMPPLPGGT